MKPGANRGYVIVERGDTLGEIARRFGDGDWHRLFAMNREAIVGEQRRRGIGRARIASLIYGADRAPPVEAHLIYPGTILRVL